ncbi:MAG: potassium channel family protein [Solirubrobacterales bacterium]
MRRQFAVIGCGRFGGSVARTLCNMGYEVMAIDANEDMIDDIKDDITYAVTADAQEEKVLENLGLRNFDVVIVAIGSDIQASILVTLLCKQMGVRKVVAKAVNDMHGRVLEKVGADKIVYPERDMGERLAHYLTRTNLLDYIEISDTHSLLEVTVPKFLAYKTLKETNLRVKYGVNVVAIKRGHELIVSPPGEEKLLPDDVLILIGLNADLERFSPA